MGSCTSPIGKTLVERLDEMANGWLCAGLPDADLPAEAAREIERLSAMLDHRNDEAAETERMLRAALRAMLDDDDHDAAKNAARAAIAGPAP